MSDGSGDTYVEGHTFDVYKFDLDPADLDATGTGDVTLYAMWEANSYTVFFNPGGGEVEYTSKQVTYGGTYGDLPVATKPGYTQEWWARHTSTIGAITLGNQLAVYDKYDSGEIYFVLSWAEAGSGVLTVTEYTTCEADSSVTTSTTSYDVSSSGAGVAHRVIPSEVSGYKETSISLSYTATTGGESALSGVKAYYMSDVTTEEFLAVSENNSDVDFEGVIVEESWGSDVITLGESYCVSNWLQEWKDRTNHEIEGTAIDIRVGYSEMEPYFMNEYYGFWIESITYEIRTESKTWTGTANSQGQSYYMSGRITIDLKYFEEGDVYLKITGGTVKVDDDEEEFATFNMSNDMPNMFSIEVPVKNTPTAVTANSTVYTASDHVLFAYYTPNSYDITFDSNGGNEADKTTTVKYGDAVRIKGVETSGEPTVVISGYYNDMDADEYYDIEFDSADNYVLRIENLDIEYHGAEDLADVGTIYITCYGDTIDFSEEKKNRKDKEVVEKTTEKIMEEILKLTK